MKLRFFFCFSFLIVLSSSLAFAELIKQSDYLYSESKNTESLKSFFGSLGRELRWYNAGSESEIVFYFIDSFENRDMNDLAKSRFVEIGLGEKGIPLLNILVFFSIEEKEVKIVYGKGCVLDYNDLDALAKRTSSEMKESNSYKPLVNLAKNLSKITSKRFVEIKDNPSIYCPIPETKKYEIKDIESEEDCKPFFKGDSFDSSRLKVLFLGKDFGSEREFKESIEEYALKGGFQKIEPFKSYTKEGYDGLFYFVYGNHDLNFDLGSPMSGGEERKKRTEETLDEISKCSNIFYTVVLVNTKDHKTLHSFYDPSVKASFNILDGIVIMHETGHRFGLSDEYFATLSISAGINEALRHFQLSCSRTPKEHWEPILGNFESYYFRTCSESDRSYRSSFESIMRNAHVYDKFNFLSCLFLVREFERSDSIMDERVRKTCMGLYESGGLQKQEEISDEDFNIKKCVEDRRSTMTGFDCKKALLKCSKEESWDSNLYSCLVTLLSEEFKNYRERTNEN